MTLLLRTFGPIELIAADGRPVTGAGAQAKPLLILALAALTPGGVPRDRLLRALWPGAGKERASASLKQHLYALRVATGEPGLVSGTKRIIVAPGLVTVDAVEFDHHIDAGRLTDASKLLRGQLLEDIKGSGKSGDELDRMVREIRERYEVRMTLVKAQSLSTENVSALLRSDFAASAPHQIVAERELTAAARRFVEGIVTLPGERQAAIHRAAWCNHDLLEAIANAEAKGVPSTRIAECVSDARHLWGHVPRIKAIHERSAEECPPTETFEWLAVGSPTEGDPVREVFERHLLTSDVAVHQKEQQSWEFANLVEHLEATGSSFGKVLLLSGACRHQLTQLIPAIKRKSGHLVTCEADAESRAVLHHRTADIQHRVMSIAGDPVLSVDEVAKSAPFSMILAGHAFDSLSRRSAQWLMTRLTSLLEPAGRLCLTTLSADNSSLLWWRYLAGWSVAGRDADEVLAHRPLESEFTMTCSPSPTRGSWLITVDRLAEENHRAPPRNGGARHATQA